MSLFVASVITISIIPIERQLIEPNLKKNTDLEKLVSILSFKTQIHNMFTVLQDLVNNCIDYSVKRDL